MELFWQKFIDGYSIDPTYWYINKRLAINAKNISLFKQQLMELKEFEGKQWNLETQSQYYAHLIRKRLIIGRVLEQNTIDKTASVRMVKAILGSLGLAWTQGIVQITDIGQKFITSKSPEEDSKIIEEQIRRYQFWNPSINENKYKVFELVPHYFLLALLSNQSIEHIGLKDEFPLFVVKAKTMDSYDEIVELILKWRTLSTLDKETIINSITQRYRKTHTVATKIQRRQPIWKTINQALPYIANFYFFPSEFNKTDNVITLSKNQRIKIKEKLDSFWKCCSYINFKSEADWFAYYGSNNKLPTIEYAQDYYLRVGDIENAKKLGYISDEQSKENLLEKQVEDILEKDVSKLEYGLELVAGGRQYQTSVGPIDLLARDSSGDFVVIELKRGRTSDKVMGQLSRYIGWVKKYLVHNNSVRGMVVGKDFNEKFILAASNSMARVDLYVFDENFNFIKQTREE